MQANAKSETYYIKVSVESINNYILSSKDKNGSVSGNVPTVTFNRGNSIIFNAFSHLFYIKNKFSRGGGDQVITGILCLFYSCTFWDGRLNYCWINKWNAYTTCTAGKLSLGYPESIASEEIPFY